MDRLDPRVDDDAIDPEQVLLGVTSIAYRAESILAALRHAGIPFSGTTVAALGLVHDALNDAMAEQEPVD